jgi:CRISPR/Cas system CMR-associated protein Cmr3 (group 5 of RAMP superfamily)
MKNPRRKKPKIGDILHIILVDHASTGGETERGGIEFEVFGRLLYEDKHSYELAYWTKPQPHQIEQDTEMIAVVKKAIIYLKILS